MRMIRTLLIATLAAALLGLAAPSSPAEAATEKVQRTVVGRYGAYPSPVTGCNEPLGPWACMIVRARPTERFATVKVTDTHGQPVYFSVLDPGTGLWAEFCGETGRPISLGKSRYLEIEVGVSRMVVQTKCPASSVKTTGTIKVTLSDLP